MEKYILFSGTAEVEGGVSDVLSHQTIAHARSLCHSLAITNNMQLLLAFFLPLRTFPTRHWRIWWVWFRCYLFIVVVVFFWGGGVAACLCFLGMCSAIFF